MHTINSAEREIKEYVIARIEPTHSRGYLIAKRFIDIVVSVAAGVVFLVPMLLIALAIRVDSRGTVIFKQERLGQNGKPFIMYKFRTMYMDAEKYGPQWAERIDWRCTRVGRLLRKTRLDELPQIWNILRGEMSIVGPRPERAYFYDQFETYIHGFCNRLVVKPGLTGWAQINGGYDLKPEEKIVFDMEYIEKQSFMLDMECILRTVRLIFTHEGAR